MKNVRAIRLFVLASAMGLCVSGAEAAIVEMTFSAPIEFSNMTAFPVGQTMTVTLRYESSSSPQLISNRQAFHVDAMRSVSMVSGGYSASQTGAFGQINKYDDLGPNDGISWQVAANAATYQFTNPKPAVVNFPNVVSNGFSQAFTGIIVNLGGNGSIWSDYQLPTSYNISQFTTTNNMLFGFSNGSFQTGFATVSSQIVEVPAPGAAAVMGVALLGARRRRR